jgi:Family of unknown function (DUF5829)
MKSQLYFYLLFIIGFVCCNQQNNKSPKDETFKKHIKFNHLYVVIDDSSYHDLFDSLKILDDFSINTESTTDAGDESWSGKYIEGKNHYLEIFKSAGAPDVKLGDFGMGFMPNKLGTIDSLQNELNTTLDSITLTSREYVEDNKPFPWFQAISLPDPDSLRISVWLMEYRPEFMMSKGFTEEDLLKEIDYWDIRRRSIKKNEDTVNDSVMYSKLFDKVTAIYLTLSNSELSLLRKSLLAFGFIEKMKSFKGNDINIYYSITDSEHFILNQIDFSLLGDIQKGKSKYKKLEFSVDANKASLKFKYK